MCIYNTMGKSKSKHLQPFNFNYITDSHTSTRQEKYDLFLAIRDDPEESVINFMKTNPWTLSCMFWFETYSYREGHIIEKIFQCSCTKDLELCVKPNVCKQEMLKRLEISIACGMCPHVIFNKNKQNVPYDQDIAACDVLYRYNLADLSNRSTRHSCIYHGGIYWIQLAILFGKIKLLNEILPFCIECKIKSTDMLSIQHHISPIVLAVLHKESEIVESIASTYTELVRYNNHFSAPVKGDHELAYYYNEFLLALHRNQFKDFKMLFQYINVQYYLDFEALWKLWIFKMRKSNMAGDENALHCLLSITDIVDVYQYQYLFHYIYTSGSYWIYKMIFEKIDFLTRFIKNRKAEAYLRILDEMMINAIFTGDSSVVKLFIDNGFNKDAMFQQCSALAWAEALNYIEIIKVLSEINAVAAYHPDDYSMMFLVIYHRNTRESLLHFNCLPIVHRLCENGHSLESPIDPLLPAWAGGQNDVVKYLLLRGADPTSILLNYRHWLRWPKSECERFIHHLIKANRTISVYEWLKTSNTVNLFMFNVNRLDIIDEVSDPGINLSVEKYVIEKMQNQSDTLLTDIAKWCSKPRRLTVLCRRALRRHYKGFQYERFLRYVKHIVPKSTYSFLELNEIFAIMSIRTSYSKEKLDKETTEVDEYFL